MMATRRRSSPISSSVSLSAVSTGPPSWASMCPPGKAHLAGMVRQVGRSLGQEDRELVGAIDEGYEHRGGYERLHRLHADVQRMVATLLGIIVGNERFVRNNSAASETILDPRARRCADHDGLVRHAEDRKQHLRSCPGEPVLAPAAASRPRQRAGE